MKQSVVFLHKDLWGARFFLVLFVLAGMLTTQMQAAVSSHSEAAVSEIVPMADGAQAGALDSVREAAPDSLAMGTAIAPSSAAHRSPYQLHLSHLILPATLIGVGLVGLESDWLKYQNREVRAELQEGIDQRLTLDDFTQYAPMAAVYGLKLCGVKSKHTYGDATILLGTAYLLMSSTVLTLKTITKVERPDGSSRNSFPSGHTATAFLGAELLRREYWNVSPWIGVVGYVVAAGTGFFRMYNNRHWFTDVIAGAGIGMLSVQAAYWLYPFLAKTFFHQRYLKNTNIAPFVSDGGKGLSCTVVF